MRFVASVPRHINPGRAIAAHQNLYPRSNCRPLRTCAPRRAGGCRATCRPRNGPASSAAPTALPVQRCRYRANRSLGRRWRLPCAKGRTNLRLRLHGLVQQMRQPHASPLQAIADDRRAHGDVGGVDRNLSLLLAWVELHVAGLVLAGSAGQVAVVGWVRDRDRERFVGPVDRRLIEPRPMCPPRRPRRSAGRPLPQRRCRRPAATGRCPRRNAGCCRRCPSCRRCCPRDRPGTTRASAGARRRRSGPGTSGRSAGRHRCSMRPRASRRPSRSP